MEYTKTPPLPREAPKMPTRRLLPLLLFFTLISSCAQKPKPVLPPKVTGTETFSLVSQWMLDNPGGAIAITSETLGRTLLITRDKKGELHTLDSWCPHQGCSVSPAQGDHLECPCHISKFSIEGGHISGPAPAGLIEYAHVQQGDELTVDFSDRTLRDANGIVIVEK